MLEWLRYDPDDPFIDTALPGDGPVDRYLCRTVPGLLAMACPLHLETSRWLAERKRKYWAAHGKPSLRKRFMASARVILFGRERKDRSPIAGGTISGAIANLWRFSR